MTPFIRELQGRDPLKVFAALKHLPYSLLLDSADPDHPTGRYSFIVSHPIETIEAKDGVVTLTNWHTQEKREGDPFKILQERLKHWIPETETIRGMPPFQGGAAGFFGYDLARGIENLPETAKSDSDQPDMAIGIYDQVMTFDHRKNQAWMITHANNYHDARKKQDYILGMISAPPDVERYKDVVLDWQANFEDSAYKDAVRKIIDYIKAGDIFQANMAQRFDAQLPKDFDSFAHYLHLRSVNPAPFAAYMNCGAGLKISSASPERFLSVKDRMVETRPIKGTQPRSDDPVQDLANKEKLEASQKDHAENTMIVDLLRNDLSKVCLANSVEVEGLCKLESFASVHHLVSTVRGKLKANKTAIDLLKACFPGGSITGAPKIRAMEIIEEMEPTRRGPYCGAMGYTGFDGAMDTSILIRTLVYQNDRVSLQVGGGIVADSQPDAEYQETLDKAAAMLASFGTQHEESNDEDVLMSA
jgi:para-aminobenzoate synthetase component 1